MAVGACRGKMGSQALPKHTSEKTDFLSQKPVFSCVYRCSGGSRNPTVWSIPMLKRMFPTITRPAGAETGQRGAKI